MLNIYATPSSETIPPIRLYKPIAVVKKTRIARSLLFIIPMIPVTKAAPAIPVRTIVNATARAGFNPGPSTSKPVRTSDDAKKRIQATLKPTDHLPAGLFGRILIRMFITSFDT